MITTKQHKHIKGLNILQMSQYLDKLYKEAFNMGVQAMSEKMVNCIDTGIRKTSGIGEKRYTELMNNITKELTKEGE